MRKTGKSRLGRPPKFGGLRRPVTVTLPEDTLARLASIDPDRARAIVKVTEAATPLEGSQREAVELVEIAPGLAIIIVGHSNLLRTIEWLQLVEVAPLRFILSIPPGTSIASLELAVLELIEEAKIDDESERSLLGRLRDLMRNMRIRGDFVKAEILFVDTRQLA